MDGTRASPMSPRRIRKRDRLKRWFVSSLRSLGGKTRAAGVSKPLSGDKDSLPAALKDMIGGSGAVVTLIGEDCPSLYMFIDTLLCMGVINSSCIDSVSDDDDWVVMAAQDNRWEEGEIDVSHVMMQDYRATIDWEKENKSINALREYAVSQNFHNVSQCYRPCILPFGILTKLATIPIFRYGATSQIVVTFPSEDEVRNVLWEFLVLEKKGHNQNQSESNRYQMLRSFWCCIYKDNPGFRPVFAVGTDDIPIPVKLVDFLGRSIQYKGLGIDTRTDLLYIRNTLSYLADTFGVLIHQLVVKTPSDCLECGIDLMIANYALDSPHRHWKVINAVSNSHLLAVAVTGGGGIPNALYRILSQPQILRRLNDEKKELSLLTIDVVTRAGVDGGRIDRLESKLQQYIAQVQAKSLVVAKLQVRPLLYLALELHKTTQARRMSLGQEEEEEKEATDTNAGAYTAMSKLISIFKSIVYAAAKVPLQKINSEWLNASRGYQNNYLGSKGQNLLTVTHQKIDMWKKSLQDSYHFVDTQLGNLMNESYANASGNWTEFADTEFDDSQTCHRVLMHRQYSNNDNVLDVLCSFVCGSVLGAGNALWSLSGLELVKDNIIEIQHMCHNFLAECIKVIRDMEDNVVHKSMLNQSKACLSLYMGINNREMSAALGKLYQELQSASGGGGHILVKNAFRKALDTVFNTRVECDKDQTLQFYQSLIQERLWDLIHVTVQYIQESYADMIVCAIQTLDQLEKSVDKCVHVAANPEMMLKKGKNDNDDDGDEEVNNVNRAVVEFVEKVEFDHSLHCGMFEFDQFKTMVEDTVLNEFSNQVRQAGRFRLVSVFGGDGNGLFRSLAECIYGEEEMHPLVRLLVIGEIASQCNKYSKYNADVYSAIDSLSSSGHAGGTMCLQAACNLYQCSVMVYCVASNRKMIAYAFTCDSGKAKHVYNVIKLPSFDKYVSLLTLSNDSTSGLAKMAYMHTGLGTTPSSELEASLKISSDSADANVPLRLSKKRAAHDDSGNDAQETIFVEQHHRDLRDSATKRAKLRKFPAVVNVPKLGRMESLKNIALQYVIASEQYYDSEVWRRIPLPVSSLLCRKFVDSNLFEWSKVGKFLSPHLSVVDLSDSHQVDDKCCRELVDKCSNIVTLDLHKCPLVTSVGISCLSKLSNLSYLDLSGCFTVSDGAIASIVRACTKLQWLNLSNLIALTNVSLQNLLLSCKELLHLDISQCCRLTDEGFRFLQKCKLRYLDLSDCPAASDWALKVLGKCCQELEEIVLKNTSHVSDVGLLCIVNGNNHLHSITLRGLPNVTPKILSAMMSRTSVTMRRIVIERCNHVTLRDLKPHLDNQNILSQLEVFKFANNQRHEERVDDIDDLDYVIQCTNGNLRELALPFYVHSPQRVLGFCPWLRHLDLNHANVTDECVWVVCQSCPSLEKLILKGTGVTNLSVKAIGSSLEKLKYLDISHCEHINDICQAFAKTELLSALLLRNLGIHDASVVNLCGNNSLCKSLTLLDISQCSNLTSASVESVCARLSNLKVLCLAFDNQIHIDAVCSTIHKLKQLESLNLENFLDFTNQSLRHSNLRSLHLSYCDNLSDQSLLTLCKHCPMLVNLDIGWCNALSQESIVTACSLAPNLFRLSLKGITAVNAVTVKFLSVSGRLVYI